MLRKILSTIIKYYYMMENLSTNELTNTVEGMDWSITKLKIVDGQKVWLSSNINNSMDYCKYLINLVYHSKFMCDSDG